MPKSFLSDTGNKGLPEGMEVENEYKESLTRGSYPATDCFPERFFAGKDSVLA